jgi:glycosyltransferase involved in cell wall biosynthesis
VCSQFQARLTEARGRPPDIIPLGVDRSIFTPGARPEGPPWRLVHVASLNRIKEQAMLIDAFKGVIERLPAVHLDIVGEDTLHGAVQSYARRAGLDAHVTFHGFLPTDRLVPFYQRAHLLVMSSRHEAAGVSVLEAAACGVPAVGTAVGYLADWSPDRAMSVPPGDARALADAVLTLIADRAARDRLADAARAWTLAHDAEWTAQTFSELYEQVRTLGN